MKRWYEIEPSKDDLEWLDGEDFYNLCQYYRHMPITEPGLIRQAFDDLKNYIRRQVKGQAT